VGRAFGSHVRALRMNWRNLVLSSNLVSVASNVLSVGMDTNSPQVAGK
jgi:hypothetical protein